MNVGGEPFRTLRVGDDVQSVEIIDQTLLPHAFERRRLSTLADVALAIRTLQVRGAPLIGVAAAYGVWLALLEDESSLERACDLLVATRPTAVNLRWAVEEVRRAVLRAPRNERVSRALQRAGELAEDDVETCRRIGVHGAEILQALAAKKAGGVLHVLTHCNAGWLATVDWGTALAPVYRAHDAGVALHVWVDETRPRSQGFLTAWELGQHGVPHTIVADNAGGHLLQRGLVDVCLVGTDRTTATGDVCNKIGTYLKALAAHDNGVPFYVGLPHSTIDWTLEAGSAIPIEERGAREVHEVSGRLEDGRLATVTVTPAGSAAANPAFDVTPARLVTGLITERGVCPATREGLLGLYPERR